MKRFSQAAAIALVFAVGGAASAATLVQYDTAASTSNATIAASTVATGLAADDLSAGGGLTANSGGTYNWRGWNDDNPTASFADAVGDGDFWSWGFDVTDALNVDLTSFDIRLDRSGTGPNQFEIQASVNGGTGISLLSDDFGTSSSGRDYVGIDLTALGTLTQGDSVVFTLAAFGVDSGGGSSAGTFDLETVDFNGPDERSIRIEGTTSAVPEPGTIAGLFSLGLAGAVAGRRRRRS